MSVGGGGGEGDKAVIHCNDSLVLVTYTCISFACGRHRQMQLFVAMYIVQMWPACGWRPGYS